MNYGLKHTGSLIRDLRLRKHMTQHELAILANVDAAVILRIERGDTIPNLNTIIRLAKGLDCEPFIVFKENNDKVGGLD
mgnify:CR=1 FL=1